MVPPAPVAAILSNKLVVDNDGMRDDVFDANVEGKARNVSGNGMRSLANGLLDAFRREREKSEHYRRIMGSPC